MLRRRLDIYGNSPNFSPAALNANLESAVLGQGPASGEGELAGEGQNKPMGGGWPSPSSWLKSEGAGPREEMGLRGGAWRIEPHPQLVF